jgi:hypothetical protein
MTLVSMPVSAVRLNGAVTIAVSLASACSGFEGTRVFGTGVSARSGAWTGQVVSAGLVIETVESVRTRAVKLLALKPLAALAVEQPVQVEQMVEQPVLVGGFGHEQDLVVRGYVGGGQQDRPETDRQSTNGTNGSTSTNGSTNGTNPIDPWELRISSPPG